MRIHVNDIVVVITGNDRGTRGKVLQVDHHTGKIIVEGVHRVFKHMRRSQRNPQGGRLSKEMPIPASNVMLVSAANNQPTRVGYRYLADGTKERYCKKTGAGLGVISPPRAAYSKSRSQS